MSSRSLSRGLSISLRVVAVAVAVTGCTRAHVHPPEDGGAGKGDGTGGDRPGVGGAGGDNGSGGSDGAGGGTGLGGSGAGGSGAGGSGAGGSGAGGSGAGGSTPTDAGTGGADSGAPDGPVGTPPTIAGQLVISEIMYDTAAAVSDDVGEWFEIHNPSPTQTYDLIDCIAYDSSPNNMDAVGRHLTIAPNANLLFARSAPGISAPIDFTYASVKFSDAGDSLRLICGGVLIDSVNFATFLLAQGFSFSLDPRHMSSTDNDLATSWCRGQTPYDVTAKGADFGSPGVDNPQCP